MASAISGNTAPRRRNSRQEIEAHTNRPSVTGLTDDQERRLLQQQKLDERRRSFAEINAMLDKGLQESQQVRRKSSFGSPGQLLLRPKAEGKSLENLFLASRWYRSVVVVITLVALFAFDFNLAFLPSSFDLSTTVILIVVFAAFVVDISVNVSLRRPTYFLSFYFWLDVIGTASLLPDIIELLDLLQSGPSIADDLNIARAGRAGRLARSAGTLKLAKFAKFFRVVRLVRVVRIFRVIKSTKVDDSDDEAKAKPSKIGLLLSDLITKRVIIIVICLILVVPLLQYNAEDMYTLRPLIPTTLEMISILPPGSAEFNASVSFLLRDEPEIIYLRVGDYPPSATRDELWRLNDLRKTMEVALFCYPPCAVIADENAASESELSVAEAATAVEVVIDVSDHVKTQSLMQMLLAMFIVLVFATGSFVISHETNFLIVKPIERMTAILRKLAGTVFVLSMAEGENFDHDDMEIDMLEQIVSKMAEIFNVVPSKGGRARAGGIGGTNKGLSMLAGRKYTEISTHSTIYKIDVSEEPNVSGNGRARKRVAPSESKGSVEKDSTPPSPELRATHEQIELPGGRIERVSDHEELCSLQKLLRCPEAAYELKLFMSQNLMIENFLFWHEVERFRLAMIAHAERIFKSYVSANALTEINIQADVREDMTNAIFETAVGGVSSVLRIDVFDAAQREVFSLMRDNAHVLFLQSPYCARYVFKKLALKNGENVTRLAGVNEDEESPEDCG